MIIQVYGDRYPLQAIQLTSQHTKYVTYYKNNVSFHNNCSYNAAVIYVQTIFTKVHPILQSILHYLLPDANGD
jgi:hypothetical protein